MTTDNEFISAKEAASMLGIAVPTFYQYGRKHAIPYEKDISGWRVYRVEDIERVRQQRSSI